MTNPLQRLRELGQSVWYDNLSRGLLLSGELQRMIDEDGVSGVTSNPTIFEKAINSERFYDHDLHVLVDSGLQVQEIYEELVLEDIRQAADALLPVYEASGGTDGFVSLEVSPHLAHDPAGTREQAIRLFQRAARKNVMIKIPATPKSLEVVPGLLADGVNINITLIFSLQQYRKAVEAYMNGIRQRIEAGREPATVASVASVFVSRVDTAIDEHLKQIIDPARKAKARSLLGKTAVAHAKMIYALYKELFQGAAFSELRNRGARSQKIVWASTSTKNPEYSETLYVDELIGPETINTMPTATLVAFRNKGKVTGRLEQGLEEARAVFPELEALGIDIDEIMESLLENGLQAFADSFDALLAGIAMKRTRLVRGWGHRSASLGDLQPKVDECLAALDKHQVAHAIWTGDASIWTNATEEFGRIAQRLGWLHAVETMAGETQRLREFADEIRRAGFTQAVLLGMGGSSLSTEVFATCFPPQEGFLDVKVLDTTVPAAILELEKSLDKDRTLFIVSSKSGTTIEVDSLFRYFWDRMESLKGPDIGSHFIAITDPGTSLGRLASEKGFRRRFLNPPDIGGRFSALSYFGLAPAALLGMDLDRLLMRAAQAVEASAQDVPALESQGVWLGAILAQAALAGRDKMTLILSPPIASFGCWLEQLVAESTGKQGTGILPIDGEPLGAPEVYGEDRLFVFLRMDDSTIYDEKVSALEKSGHPVLTVRFHSPYDIGREMFRWEFATAVAAAILKINPFDEPNVTESKDLTKRALKTFQREKALPEGEHISVHDTRLVETLQEFLGLWQPGDYVAFNAFLTPSQGNRDLLQSMRIFIRDRLKAATTVGFGPRYLHSTGQFHKGGTDKGLFIQITTRDVVDIDIPGAGYSFGILKSAQSLGDYEALKNKGRRIIRVHLDHEQELVKLHNAFLALRF